MASLVTQHDDVEEVEKCSKNTDDYGEVAVGSPVGVLSSKISFWIYDIACVII